MEIYKIQNKINSKVENYQKEILEKDMNINQDLKVNYIGQIYP